MTTLLQCTKLTDGAVSVEIAVIRCDRWAHGALSITYLLDISTDDLVACLASQGVKFVNVFVSKVVILVHKRTGRHFTGGTEKSCPENNNMP